MKLIIVRHGQTIGNSKKIIQGKMPGKLTKKGIEQSKIVGKQLKEKYPKIDLVFCSPLNRCVETLNNILEEYPIESEILMSNLLEERGFGEWEGTEENLIDWEEIDKDSVENKKMGVESWVDVQKRVELFLEDLKLEDNKETVLIVSHGGPIKVMINKITGKDFDSIEVENGKIIELDYETELEY